MNAQGTTKNLEQLSAWQGPSVLLLIASDMRHMPLASKMYVRPHGRKNEHIFVGFANEEGVMPYNLSDTTCFRCPCYLCLETLGAGVHSRGYSRVQEQLATSF